MKSDISDFINSVYPEINANTMGGSAAFVTAPKNLNSATKPTRLASFTISKNFHPGYSPEKANNYTDRFALDIKPTILKVFYISKDFHPGQSEEAETEYSERFALDSEEERAPKRETKRKRRYTKRESLPEPKKAKTQESSSVKPPVEMPLEEMVGKYVIEKLQAVSSEQSSSNKKVEAEVQDPKEASKQSSSNKKVEADVQDPKESGTETDTIMVDTSESAEATDSDAEPPAKKIRGTKRSRSPITKSSDDEPPVKKTRNSKKPKATKKFHEEPSRLSSRSQKRMPNKTVRKSPRVRSPVNYK